MNNLKKLIYLTILLSSIMSCTYMSPTNDCVVLDKSNSIEMYKFFTTNNKNLVTKSDIINLFNYNHRFDNIRLLGINNDVDDVSLTFNIFNLDNTNINVVFSIKAQGYFDVSDRTYKISKIKLMDYKSNTSCDNYTIAKSIITRLNHLSLINFNTIMPHDKINFISTNSNEFYLTINY